MSEPTVDQEQTKDPLKQLEERLGPKLEQAKERLETINEKTKGFIRDNPGVSLLGAAVAGFLVGRLVSKK